MKKRHLRKEIEIALNIITVVLFLLIVTIDEISIAAIPLLITMVAVLIVNIQILKRFGKGVWNE